MWLAACLLALRMSFATGPPEASSQAAASVPASTRVRIAIGGPAPRRAAAREVLAELLGRVDVELEWVETDALDPDAVLARPPESTPLLAFVFVDLDGIAPTVYVTDGRYERMLVRRLGDRPEFDEVAREEVATIVLTAVEALQAGTSIGVARGELAPGASPSPRVVPSRPTLAVSRSPLRARVRAAPQLAIEAGLRVEGFGRQSARTIAEFGLALQGRARIAAEAALWGGALVPNAITTTAPELRVVGGTLRGQLGARVLARPALAWFAAAGFGLDVLVVRTSEGHRGRAQIPTANLQAGAHYTWPNRVALRISAILELDLVDTRIVVRTTDRVLFDPWRVWPGIAISVGGRVTR